MKNKLTPTIWLLLLSLGTAASATTFARVTLDELYAPADFVAIIRVLEGGVLSRDASECGVKYRAQVVETIKGVALPKTIEFGRNIGYEIGTWYMVFLSLKGDPFNPMLSTNSDAIRERVERERSCAVVWPKMTARGFSINWYEEKWKSSRAVRIHPDAVIVPNSGYANSTGAHAYPIYDAYLYVPLDHVSAYLKALPDLAPGNAR